MLKFATLSSDIELPFYLTLASHKINHDKLDDSTKPLLGLYEITPKGSQGDGVCKIQIRGNALSADEVPQGLFRAEGAIKNVNTIEDYRKLDRAKILNQAGRTIWEAINDGTIYSCPSLLASFTSICFADLKKYIFTYHFGFPAIRFHSTWKIASHHTSEAYAGKSGEDDVLLETLNSEEAVSLVDKVQTWRYSVDSRQYGFFLAKKVRHLLGSSVQESGQQDQDQSEQFRPVTPGTPGERLNFKWEVDSLAKYEDGFFDEIDEADRFVCFADPSSHDQYPGWMLRNLLALIRARWSLETVQILCYRDVHAYRHAARSKIIQLNYDDSNETSRTEAPENDTTLSNNRGVETPRFSGWEANSTRKIASKVSNLGEYMDPQRSVGSSYKCEDAERESDSAPGLDLEKIKETKCLLLGAGTLGSYVARNLMGWGVRTITFADNGRVSFSNPVRQPLFTFNDCLNGGSKKAQRAAEALKEVYPGIQSVGWDMSVPMAGHPIMDEAKVESDFYVLRNLIEGHDAIFLLMDTRESRWLPSVMGKAMGKIVVNAALGFDTFLVMRHGFLDKDTRGRELGCYFCNDVVAPADSISDRTLDQQCTVTRPGIAAIASALLVELLVSIIQHPQGPSAPAPKPGGDEKEDDHPLGIVPHTIRGYLSTFNNMVLHTDSYEHCSACSGSITDAYLRDGWEFVKRALNENGYVEELSGLAEVQRIAEEAAAEVEWDSEEGTIEEGDGEMI